MDLRDSSLSLWSSPVPSKKLDKLFKRECRVTKPVPPKLHSARDIREKAAAAEEEKRLTALGMQEPNDRSPSDVRFICGCVSALVPFFRLWPENLQMALARVLRTEVLVRQESVLARGTPCTRVVFVLSGKLSVLVPSNDGSSTQAHRNGDHSSDIVAATLKRGDACGEAALLGDNPMSHADVVVASRGAVLLSLPYEDFSRALKGILGLRQQDRLAYLRMHPLFAGVNLGDLDTLSDALQLVHYPAGTLLSKASSALSTSLPAPNGASVTNSTKTQQGWAQQVVVYLLIEGCAAVRRGQLGGGASNARLSSGRGLRSGAGLYDEDTVCLLQHLDVFGPQYLPPGTHVEAVTDIKLYCLLRDEYDTLPPQTQKLLEEAQVFMSQYSAGKEAGLQRIDAARQRPSYGAYHYKVGDVLLASMGAAGAHTLPQSKDTNAGRPSLRGPGPPAMTHSHGININSSMHGQPSHAPVSGPVPLDVLHAQQVIAAMDLCPYKDPHTGLPLPFTKAQGLRNQKPEPLTQQQQVRHGSLNNEHPGPGTKRNSPGEHSSLQSCRAGPAAVNTAAGMKQPQSTAWWPSPNTKYVPQQQQQQQQRRPQVLIQQQPHSDTELTSYAPLSLSAPPFTDEQLAPNTATTFFLTQDPNQASEPQQQSAAPPPSSQLLAKIGPRPSSPRRRDHPDVHKLAGKAGAAARGKSATTVPRLPTLGSQVYSQTAPLSVLPPTEKAWPRVEVARRHVVETEAPHPQKVPVTLRQRHAIIFNQARQYTEPTLRRNLSVRESSSDEEDAPKLATKRQPSRRMSGDRRSSLSRRSHESHSAYDRRRKQQQQQLLQGGSGGGGSSSCDPPSPRTVMSTAANNLAESETNFTMRRSSVGGAAGEVDGVLLGAEVGVEGRPRSGGEPGGTAEGGLGVVGGVRRRSSREGRRSSSSGDGSDLGLVIHQAGEQSGGHWQESDARQGGGDVLDLENGRDGWQAQAMAGQQQQQQQQHIGQESLQGQPHALYAQHQVYAQVQQPHPPQTDNPTSPFTSQQRSPRQAQGIPKTSPTTASQQEQGSRSPSGGVSGFSRGPREQRLGQKGGGAGSLVEEAIALPPSVMLGYETLDPFSMATLLSYATQRTSAASISQDGILPRPGWS
ncbi:hypothetical protein DUNSADRAFT_8433 [Dunaliella salina]|uniref:Cyclic nucleotide-binding domain-containing protein n=1 Tax=Dunaliella salina TaxID=3046 RepID=A0ABQ7GJK7_DUNSA|nr:hypothetical protein DUNSADRAFT_8433 [Dunaliella salina]|eukprot:KAF5834792.1 hypothetical protein DUNSADRAFT_8433 [Dunaliella salina]